MINLSIADILERLGISSQPKTMVEEQGQEVEEEVDDIT